MPSDILNMATNRFFTKWSVLPMVKLATSSGQCRMGASYSKLNNDSTCSTKIKVNHNYLMKKVGFLRLRLLMLREL